MISSGKLAPEASGNPFRHQRMKALAALAADYDQCRIVDLGGTAAFWEAWAHLFDWSRTHVTCINTVPDVATSGRVTMVKGDATELFDYPPDSFDIAFSNSLIEHLPRHRRRYFAEHIGRVARSYFIQTPDFWFPIESHARMPLIHWLPRWIAETIVMTVKCGYLPKATSRADARRILNDADLLTAKKMRRLFPDAEIRHERFMGLSKALVAVRHLPTQPAAAEPLSFRYAAVPAPPSVRMISEPIAAMTAPSGVPAQ